MTTIVALPSNASKWQMGFNSAFKGLSNGEKEFWFSQQVRTANNSIIALHNIFGGCSFTRSDAMQILSLEYLKEKFYKNNSPTLT